MTALLALALAAAPGCPEALAAAAGLESPRDLGTRAPAVVALLVERGAGGPAEGLAAEADAFAEAARAGEGDLGELASRFRARLERHCALAAERPAAPALRPGDRAALREILARPEFSRARGDPGALTRWLAAIWRRILDLLGTEEAGRYAAGGRTAFFAAVALAAAAGLAFALRRRRAAGRRAAAPVATAAAPARDAREAAATWRGRGVRDGFLSLLQALERRGRIPRGRALTNRELASHLAAAPGLPPGLASGFAALADAFDRTVYGGVPMSGRDLIEFVQQLHLIRTLAEAGA